MGLKAVANALAGGGTLPATAYPLLAPDGLVGAPSYSFASSPTTGLYQLAAGQFGITTGGTLRAFIDSNGLTVNLLRLSTGNSDSGISRLASASLAFGNGTQGDTTAALSFGKVAKLGADTTSGAFGVPVVVATGRATAQVAANASVSTYTVGAADGSFEVSANVNVTAATTASFTVTCTYTDETNVSRVLTFGFTQLSGATFLTVITNVTGTGPYESPIFHIRCKAATAITLATTGTFTSVAYNVEGIIKQTA